MKKVVITLILIIGNLVFCKAQTTINDYKYVVVPHFYEFVKGKDAYRLNTITRYLLRKKGLTAFMEDEIKESDYESNNCLALKANVISVNSMLKTKLKVVLKNCDGDIVFESKEGESKSKTYDLAYKNALTHAFESFDGINYKYKPNKGILSRAEESVADAKVSEAEKEVEKLKAEIQKLKKDKVETVDVQEKINKAPISETVKKAKEKKPFLKAKRVINGFELLNSQTGKIEYVLQKTAMKDIFTLKDQKGIVYKKEGKWFREYANGDSTDIEFLDIRF